VTDYTEADAAAERLLQDWAAFAPTDPPVYIGHRPVDERDDDVKVARVYQQLRTENARLTADLAAARAERDAARQAAADWRLLAECCALRGVMQFLTAMRHINDVASGHDGLRFALAFLAADSHRGDITRSLVAAARRLADAAKGES